MKYHGLVKPAPQGLINLGPLIPVTLTPTEEIAKALIKSGVQIHPVKADLMLDTGAQSTVIEDSLAQSLGLRPLRFRSIIGVSQKPEMHPVYRMQISIVMKDSFGHSGVGKFVADVCGMPSPPQPTKHRGLLGRDFLRYFRFSYDGTAGSYEIVDVEAEKRESALARQEQIQSKILKKQKLNKFLQHR
jgi:hypothetical protein